MDETQKFLGKIDLFKELEPTALAQLAKKTRPVYFPEGHLIRDTSRNEAVDNSNRCCRERQVLRKFSFYRWVVRH